MIKQGENLGKARTRASFMTQAKALGRKNFALQKRNWSANLVLLLSPFLVCMLLFVLEHVINNQLNARSFRCGCKCVSCCDWIPYQNNDSLNYVYTCYNATTEQPCSPYASCSSYDDSQCGYLYSTADQVGFCEVSDPPLWPSLLQVPFEAYRGPKYPEIEPEGIPPPPFNPETTTVMLYTGENATSAGELMDSMWARSQLLTSAVLATYMAVQSRGGNLPVTTMNHTLANETDLVEGTTSLSEGLYYFGLVMGTSASTATSMLLEPAFVDTNAISSSNYSRQPLYFAQRNCSALSVEDRGTLSQIGQAITNMTGFAVKCLSFMPVLVPSAKNMSDQVYCSWLSSNCIVRYGSVHTVSIPEILAASHPVQGFVGALYDWHNTDASLGRLKVSVWVNNTDIARDPSVPDVQRWSQSVNLASNAFLKQMAGHDYSVRLIGVSDMPKGATHLSLDFSSLLGPLFMMWFFQMMLPTNVYMLVHEKELHLRIMQRMQGLNEVAYYVVQYIWMLTLYSAFTIVFVSFGSVIGLKFFTLNSYTVQLVFYFLWGNMLTGFSFFFASWCSEARSAVLFSIVYVIITGFVANLVLVQYVEQGPKVISDVMELIPAFALFRGLYELAQYAFLADRNGGEGLDWDKLTNLDCGMLQVWLYLFVGSCVLPIIGYYIEQVNGSGSGVKRHPLFFLATPSTDKEYSMEKRKLRQQSPSSWGCSWVWQLCSRKRQMDAACKKATLVQDFSMEATSPLQSPLDYYYGASSTISGTGNVHPNHLGSEEVPKISSATKKQETTFSRSNVLASFREIDLADERPCINLASNGDEEYTIHGSASLECENMDVWKERQRVEVSYRKWKQGDATSKEPPAAILLRQLRKVYPPKNRNPEKVAVHDLSLSVQHCECFGLLGPNGAGKTTTLRIMEGFIDPSSGCVIIEGLSIPEDIDQVYSLTGACPQHDLLWDTLTGREHLLFYGRIKNLGGLNLIKSVDSTLRSVNLFDVQNNLVSTYSGGMKRRLSVAIALIGDPLVVYLDEPTTGLDPSSRRLLWEVIRQAREDKALVLTTHSMEEAEALCDRLGIFVNGRLECIGNPKELTARYGGYLSFSLTTPIHQEATAAGIIKSMVPGAKLVYSLGGTQKYELPLEQITVDDVFRRMEEAKYRKELEILDWGVSNATLEEVFIKITRDAGVRMEAWT